MNRKGVTFADTAEKCHKILYHHFQVHVGCLKDCSACSRCTGDDKHACHNPPAPDKILYYINEVVKLLVLSNIY